MNFKSITFFNKFVWWRYILTRMQYIYTAYFRREQVVNVGTRIHIIRVYDPKAFLTLYHRFRLISSVNVVAPLELQ